MISFLWTELNYITVREVMAVNSIFAIVKSDNSIVLPNFIIEPLMFVVPEYNSSTELSYPYSQQAKDQFDLRTIKKEAILKLEDFQLIHSNYRPIVMTSSVAFCSID